MGPWSNIVRAVLLSTFIFGVVEVSSNAALAAIQEPERACSGEQNRQFDFWVGEWEVRKAGEREITARSRIEKLYGGCVIRESWMPLKGNGGGSLNHYDASDKRWHQTWIDGSNTRVVFEGGLVKDAMVLTGFWRNFAGPQRHALVRMTYTPLADGSVRQFGEASSDRGLSWKPAFNLIYSRSSEPAP